MKLITNLIKNVRNTKFGFWLEKNFVSYLAWLIIQTISRTVKIKKVNFAKVEELFKQKKNVIYTFFHGEQFLLIFVHRNENVVIMSSLSRDGELQSKILSKFGFDIVRGSTKKGFVSSTKSILEKLSLGQNVAFAVDGPKGPVYKVKPGAVFLAQKTQFAIIPTRVRIKNKIQLNNWDKYIIPLPFTKAEILYGEPFFVKETESIKDVCYKLEQKMQDLIFLGN